MTTDTAAIRAQYSDGEYLDAYPGEACATILALCDALDEMRADIETCTAKRDEWADRAMTELGNVLDLRAENDRLRAELAWYGEQSRLARIIHSEGDSGRHALQADGGHRARDAIAQKEGE